MIERRKQPTDCLEIVKSVIFEARIDSVRTVRKVARATAVGGLRFPVLRLVVLTRSRYPVGRRLPVDTSLA